MDNHENKANESSPNKDGTEDHNPKDGAGAKEIPKVEADKPEHYGPESSKSNKKEKKKSSCMGCFPYCGAWRQSSRMGPGMRFSEAKPFRESL